MTRPQRLLVCQVPMNEGRIDSNSQLFDSSYRPVARKPVTMLIPEVYPDVGREMTFQCVSHTGAMRVSFVCDHYHEPSCLLTRRLSSHFDGLSMLKSTAGGKTEYRCFLLLPDIQELCTFTLETEPA